MPYIAPEDDRPEQPLNPEITGPMGWEDEALPWLTRLYRTLEATFAPLASLRAVAGGEVAPALRFMLLSAVPWMLLWAIIPFTHTLNFESSFRVSVLKDASGLPIELDIVRAMAIGLVFNGLAQLSWAMPFVSLLAGFANGSRPEDPKRAGWRTALYRMWVVPFGMTLFFLVPWALPSQPSDFVVELAVLALQMLPRMLILIHCHVMARYFGASGLGALVVSLVPLLVQWAVGLSLQEVAVRLLPALPVPPA
ncbi:MAG TPA: hypothetical protein VFX59_21505 [Polyangiales bacterium]|nr:hypothetical protein [Polyangiales bacterium]